MPTLIIAEKPSVARGIADAVGAHERRDGYIEGGGYLISWCRGHIIDLDFPQNYPQWSGHWSMSQLPMIPERWRWSVTAPEQYKVLKGLLDRADVELVVNACDADREGEGIFRRVWTHSGCKKPVRRFWSTSLVPEQVRTDLAHAKPLSDYDGLADASEGRAKADWLVGLNASRALSCLYEGSRLSAGRVQTPTLALVVERTRAIRDFKSVPFFQVECSVGRTAHVRLAGEKLKTRQEAERRAHAVVGSQCAILKVERRQEKCRAPKLYDLTGLQRDASTRAGLTAEETLNALQTLYEKKLATYPRRPACSQSSRCRESSARPPRPGSTRRAPTSPAWPTTRRSTATARSCPRRCSTPRRWPSSMAQSAPWPSSSAAASWPPPWTPRRSSRPRSRARSTETPTRPREAPSRTLPGSPWTRRAVPRFRAAARPPRTRTTRRRTSPPTSSRATPSPSPMATFA